MIRSQPINLNKIKKNGKVTVLRLVEEEEEEEEEEDEEICQH